MPESFQVFESSWMFLYPDAGTLRHRIKYERIAKRRGKKLAIIAIAKMMLTAAYHMFQTGEVFNPCDLYQADMPVELRK